MWNFSVQEQVEGVRLLNIISTPTDKKCDLEIPDNFLTKIDDVLREWCCSKSQKEISSNNSISDKYLKSLKNYEI